MILEVSSNLNDSVILWPNVTASFQLYHRPSNRQGAPHRHLQASPARGRSEETHSPALAGNNPERPPGNPWDPSASAGTGDCSRGSPLPFKGFGV